MQSTIHSEPKPRLPTYFNSTTTSHEQLPAVPREVRQSPSFYSKRTLQTPRELLGSEGSDDQKTSRETSNKWQLQTKKNNGTKEKESVHERTSAPMGTMLEANNALAGAPFSAPLNNVPSVVIER